MEYIYLLKNKETNRVYVGRSCNPQHRFKQHMYALNGRYHKNELMQEDFDLHGKDSFQMEIVQESFNFTRSGIEGEWIVKLRTYDKRFGYNYKDPYVWHRRGKPTRRIKKELQEV